jgi:hypothetical protein
VGRIFAECPPLKNISLTKCDTLTILFAQITGKTSGNTSPNPAQTRNAKTVGKQNAKQQQQFQTACQKRTMLRRERGIKKEKGVLKRKKHSVSV